MSDKQLAIETWIRLIAEMGSTAHTRSSEPFGEIARHRVRALIALYFAILKNGRIPSLIEIGSHNAETSRKFVETLGGRAHAYEANKSVFEKAAAAFQSSNLTFFNEAIGDHDGHTSFFIPASEKYAVWASTKRRSGDVETVEVSVPMCTLDTAVRRISQTGSSKDVALWIDVEGAGLDVLASGVDVLQKNVAMVFIEVNDLDTYAKSATALDIIAILQKAGFSIIARDNQYKDAWNLLAVHEEVVSDNRQEIAKWLYRHNGNNHVAQKLFEYFQPSVTGNFEKTQ